MTQSGQNSFVPSIKHQQCHNSPCYLWVFLDKSVSVMLGGEKSQILHVQHHLTYWVCLFPFSSWPFSLTDSIQPVALRVTRPLIALVKSFDHAFKTKIECRDNIDCLNLECCVEHKYNKYRGGIFLHGVVNDCNKTLTMQNVNLQRKEGNE